MRLSTGWCRIGATTAVMVAGFGTLALPAGARPASENGGTVTACAPLSQGAAGAAVTTIQKLLKVNADGDFGPQTAKALRHWQRSHGVTVSGAVDAATWAALPAGTAARACGHKVHGKGLVSSCAALSSGDQGVAVAVLQKALGIAADGDFGPATEQALKQAQRDAKLDASGTTDRATWKSLGRRGTPACTAPHQKQPLSADQIAQAKVRARVLQLTAALESKPGTTKNKVALQAMQFAQKQIGKPYKYGATGPRSYDCSGLQMASYLRAGLTIPRVASDQYLSGGTKVPLDQARQGDLLFYASDVTKPSTVYHVVMYVGHGQVLDAPYTGANVGTRPLWSANLLPKAVRPTAKLTLPLKTGSSGWSVSQLQQALNRHGAGLAVDGGFGSTTRSAVKSWQAKHSLKANGVVHVATWLSLG